MLRGNGWDRTGFRCATRPGSLAYCATHWAHPRQVRIHCHRRQNWELSCRHALPELRRNRIQAWVERFGRKKQGTRIRHLRLGEGKGRWKVRIEKRQVGIGMWRCETSRRFGVSSVEIIAKGSNIGEHRNWCSNIHLYLPTQHRLHK